MISCTPSCHQKPSSGGYELTSYLIGMGHRDIGYIGTVKATSSIFDRYMGYMKAMIDAGLEVNKQWTLMF